MIALRTAIVAIVEADGPQGTVGTLQNLCARTSDLIRLAGAVNEAKLPLITYLLIDVAQGAGSNDQRVVLAQLDCWADAATGGLGKAEQLADRLEAILIEPKIRAQSVDAAPVEVRRRDANETEDDLIARRRGVTVEVTFAYKRG